MGVPWKYFTIQVVKRAEYDDGIIFFYFLIYNAGGERLN